MAKPTRTFSAEEGQPSTGTAGPSAIKNDIDSALKMFDPDATLPGGDPGGIGSDNMKPGASTDTIIGDRTINQAAVPAGNTGKLTTLLSGLANRILAITGKTDWYDAPDTTLAAAKAHMDAAAPHSGHLQKIDGVSGDAEGNVDFVAGTGIVITPNATSKTITFTAQGGQVPGPHASTHATGGSDPITPASIGAETPTGAQAKADVALAAAKDYVDQNTGKVIAILQVTFTQGTEIDPGENAWKIVDLPTSAPVGVIPILTHISGSSTSNLVVNVARVGFLQHQLYVYLVNLGQSKATLSQDHTLSLAIMTF